MQRYFLKEKLNNNFVFYEKDKHHIKDVMRLKINDQIEGVWNNTIYLLKIDEIEPLLVSVVDTYEEQKKLEVNLTIAISLVQEQKFDLIIQKLTELGVNKIIPIQTERSKVKIKSLKLEHKMKRWYTIAKEASEQSKRTDIPEISQPIKLINIHEYIDKNTISLVCSLNKSRKKLKEILENNKGEDLMFIIGPEGGFTEKEEKFMLDNQVIPVNLGKRILRVETASIYVASIINYVCGG